MLSESFKSATSKITTAAIKVKSRTINKAGRIRLTF